MKLVTNLYSFQLNADELERMFLNTNVYYHFTEVHMYIPTVT